MKVLQTTLKQHRSDIATSIRSSFITKKSQILVLSKALHCSCLLQACPKNCRLLNKAHRESDDDDGPNPTLLISESERRNRNERQKGETEAHTPHTPNMHQQTNFACTQPLSSCTKTGMAACSPTAARSVTACNTAAP